MEIHDKKSLRSLKNEVKNGEEKNGEKLMRRENELERRSGEVKSQFYRRIHRRI
jgi:hypothetical protein